MNKHLYRVIFNHALGLWQAVSELVRRPGRGAGQANGVVVTAVRPVSLGLWVAFGWIGFASVASAQIATDMSAPGNQRPTVMGAPGTAPVINITTPSKAGISRNTYRDFNVTDAGAVLNNSRTNTQTHLAGSVAGNPWLATGTAKVILNEVTGAHPSALNGYIEVAGDRAQVIVANPAGISCDGCGVINANRFTLTTGVPQLLGGALDSYRVTGGVVSIHGNGLDASRADYTDIIARAVQVNGGIWSPQLQVTTGANLVSADHTQVAAMRSSGDKPTFALDVSALGGMYANKIVLLGTEQGVGVRNAGTLGAQAGDLIVTADGRLENTGKLQSQSNTAINASGGVTNAGTLSATRELTISTPQDVDNSHGTLNAGRIAVDADALRNAGGTIAQTGLQAMALHVGELSNKGGRMGAPDVDAGSGGAAAPNAGSGSTAEASSTSGSHGPASDTPSITPMEPLADGALRISGTLNNDDGRISAASGFDLTTTRGLVNDGGHLDLRQLTLNGGNLSNRGGELAIDGTATVHAATLTNDSGQLTFHGPLTINAQTLSNRGGTLYQLDKSATTLTVAGMLDNTDGTLASNASALTIASGALINERGTIQHVGTAGFTLTLGSWQGAGGTVATASAANIAAGTIDHRGATLSATELTFVADDLDNRAGVIVTSDASPNTLTVAGTLDNGDGGTLASNGDLQISATTLGNAGGTIQQAGQGSLAIYATALHGAGGTLASNGHLMLAGGTFDLRNGITYAQGIAVDAVAFTTAGGQLSAFGTSPLSIHVRGVLDNTAGTIATNGVLQLNAQSLNNTDGTLTAAGRDATTVTVADAFDNARGTLAIAGATTLHAGSLNNTAGTVQAADTSPLTVTTHGALVNDNGLVVSNGALALVAGSVSNHGGAIQAQQTIEAQVAGTLDNSGGLLVAADDLIVQADALLNRDTRNTDVLRGLYGNRVTVQAQAIDNTDGQLHANDTLALSGRKQPGAALTNAGGIVDGTGTVTVTATTLNNIGGQLIQRGESGSLIVNAGQSLNNTVGGLIGAEGAANLEAGTLDNSGGTLFAQHDLSVTSGGDLLNRYGGQLQTQGNLALTANGTLDNSGGAVDASGAAAVAADALANVGGQILAGDQNNPDASLTVVSGNHIDNRGGTLGNRGGDITLQAASIDNSAGGIAVAQRDLNLDNVGAFSNAGGRVVATRNLSYQNAGANFDNTNGTVGAGDTAWLNLGTLTNTAGQVQANTLWLTTPVLNNQDGDVGANTLHATLTNLIGLGTLHGTDTLDIHVLGDYTHQAGQHFNSDGVLSLTVDGTLTNQGTLQTQGELDVTAADLINQGTLNASATDGSARATLTIAGTLDNHEADASIAGDTLTLSANDIRNTSSQGITGDVVQINANTLTNGRDLGTADAGVAYGEGFIGASQYLELRIGQYLANLDGEIYSGGDLSIAGRTDGSRVATLDNVSGRIQAEGNGSIAADLISNRRRFIETEQYMLSPDEQYALSTERAYDGALTSAEHQRMGQLAYANGVSPLNSTERAELAAYLARLGWVHTDHVSDADFTLLSAAYNQIAISQYGELAGYIVPSASGNPGAEYKQTDTYLSGTRQLRESADSQILTGGNLNIDLGTHLTNVASTIAATGDLLISGQMYDGRPDARIDNIAVTGLYTLQRDTVAWVVDAVPVRYLWQPGDWRNDVAVFQAPISTEQRTAAGPVLAAATITGRNVAISGHDITNTAVAASGGISTLDNKDLTGLDSTTLGHATKALASGAGVVDGAHGQVVGSADQPLPGYVPPSNGRYSQHGDPASPFLITTAPRFAKGPSTNSDYLLRALGSDPANVHKRLGDGYYEQNLVMDQVLQLTGRRTLNGGDGLAQYQALMDGAAAEAARLGLQLGAPLTTAQIAALSSDIVWLVDQVVDGEHVLVPVVYLSKATADRMKSDGALIAGDSVNLNASGTVRNDGTITGTQSTVISADTLINTGALNGGQRLAIATSGNTVNAGTLSGNAIGILAGGSVINAPVVDGLATHGGVIQAGNGGVQIVAAQDVINQGKVTSAGDAAVVAGRDYVQNAAATSHGLHAPAGSLQVQGSAAVIAGRDAIFDQGTLIAGEAAYVNAGRDAVFNAATVSGGTGVGVVAGRDIVSTAVTDHRDTASFSKNGNTRTWGSTSDDTVRGSTFTSGGNVALQAGRDITLVAANVKADGVVALHADRDVNLLAAENTSSSTADSKSTKSGTFSKKTTTTHVENFDATVVGTTISGKQSVVIDAGRDVNAVAATATSSDGIVAVSAARDVNLFDAHNVHSEEHDQTVKKSSALGSGLDLKHTFGKKSTTTTTSQRIDDTVQGTTLSGTQGVIVTAGHDVNAVAATVTSTNGAVFVHADNDVRLLADTAATQTSQGSQKYSTGHYYGSKTETTGDTATHSRAVGTTLSGHDGVIVDAGHDVLAVAGTLKSDAGGIAVTAGHQIALLAAQNTEATGHSEKTRESGFEQMPNQHQGTRKQSSQTVNITAQGTTLDAAGPIVLVSGGNQTYQAATIKSGTGTAMISGGAINFDTATNSDIYQRDSKKHNAAYQGEDHRTRVDTTEVQTSITGPVVLAAADGITVNITQRQGPTLEQKQAMQDKAASESGVSRAFGQAMANQPAGETQDQAITRWANQPGYGWMGGLQSQPGVTWNIVDEQHINEHQHHEGMTPAAGAVVTIVAAYLTAGAASAWIGSASGAAAGSGTAMAAGTSATATSAAVSAGWANATLSGMAAGSISSGVGAAVQGHDWRTPALYGGITGGFAGYLSAGTYYDNPINSVKNAGGYIADGNWGALGNMGLDIVTTQAAGRVEAKVANELGMNGEQLNWLLMAGSIAGNAWDVVGSRYKTPSQGTGELDFAQTDETGMRGYANRGNVGLLFDTIDVVLGYQGLPDASVASAAYNKDANGVNQPRPQNLTCHSLGTVTCSYLARNGVAQSDIYLASVPFGVVAPPNATVLLGNGDAVNGFYGGQLFNWNATVVPIQFITGHPYENYKQYVDAAAAGKNK